MRYNKSQRGHVLYESLVEVYSCEYHCVPTVSHVWVSACAVGFALIGTVLAAKPLSSGGYMAANVRNREV